MHGPAHGSAVHATRPCHAARLQAKQHACAPSGDCTMEYASQQQQPRSCVMRGRAVLRRSAQHSVWQSQMQ